jgi:hypothetical protein
VHVWADGIYLQARMEDNAECMLVLIGATPEGKRNSSASRPGCARARRSGVNCSSTSSSLRLLGGGRIDEGHSNHARARSNGRVLNQSPRDVPP